MLIFDLLIRSLVKTNYTELNLIFLLKWLQTKRTFASMSFDDFEEDPYFLLISIFIIPWIQSLFTTRSPMWHPRYLIFLAQLLYFFSPLPLYPLSRARFFLPLISARTCFHTWGLVTRWAQPLTTTFLAPQKAKYDEAQQIDAKSPQHCWQGESNSTLILSRLNFKLGG